MCNRGNLAPNQKLQLAELLAANQALATVYFLKEDLKELWRYVRRPFHTRLLEGINNKINVLKRMADGYRDHEYSFLEIRAAFPGNPP